MTYGFKLDFESLRILFDKVVVSPTTKEAPEDPRVDGRSVKHPQWLAPSPDLDLPYRRPSPDSP